MPPSMYAAPMRASTTSAMTLLASWRRGFSVESFSEIEGALQLVGVNRSARMYESRSAIRADLVRLALLMSLSRSVESRFSCHVESA